MPAKLKDLMKQLTPEQKKGLDQVQDKIYELQGNLRKDTLKLA